MKKSVQSQHYINPNFKEAKGFERIYRLYFQKLFGICYHLTRDEELSQDLVQDIFLALWRKKESLEINTSLEHYLVRAAKLQAMDHIRNISKKGKVIQLPKSINERSDNSTEESIQFNELNEKVKGLVDRLPSKSVRIFKLSRDRGLSNRDIARQLDISEKGVEYHLSKAISFIRQNLDHSYL